MKQFLLRLVILAGISFLPTVSNAQLREKAEELLSTTLGNDPEEPVTPTDTLSLDEQHRKDSIKMQELALQLQEMKLNEILLKDELESTKNSNATADSLKRSEQRNRIDSLRALTPGVPVVGRGVIEPRKGHNKPRRYLALARLIVAVYPLIDSEKSGNLFLNHIVIFAQIS